MMAGLLGSLYGVLSSRRGFPRRGWGDLPAAGVGIVSTSCRSTTLGLALIALGIALIVAEMFRAEFRGLGCRRNYLPWPWARCFLFDTESSDLIVDRSIIFTAVATVGAIMLGLAI